MSKQDVSAIQYIIFQNKLIMSKIEEFQTALNSIKDSTANIAADLQRLADQAAGGVSAEDATAFGAQLQAAADALKAVADVNPEPVVEPPVTEPTTPEAPAPTE